MPGKLEYSFNHSKLGEFPLAKEVMTIGRADDNDIRIDNLAVSAHHAKLLNIFDDSFLEDLNSTNGTFVNSKRVSNHVLKHEDVVTIGHHRIKFHDPYATSHRSPDGLDLSDTVIMKTLDDMRTLLAHENTALMPTASEDLPTLLP